MTRTMTAVVLAAVLSAGAYAAGGHDHGKMEKGHQQGSSAAAGETVTLKGELLDMACYMAHEGKGEKHKKCAKSCVLGGAPIGLLSADGAVYLLVGDHANEKPYKAAQQLAGEQAKITGTVQKRGGVQAIVVSKTEKP